MSVAVEPTLSNRTELPIDHKAPRPAQQQLKSKLLFPVKFTLTVVVFLIVIAYMVPVALLQGIGMLGLGLTMPKIMIYVYPSRLGKIHVLVLWAWRRLSLGDEGHTRSVRIELEALEPRDGQPGPEADAAEAEAPHTMPYAVHTVACLLDNYAYIIVDLSGRPPHPVALVDPCESKAVVRALERLRQDEYGGAALEVTAVLCTHHHWDHAWGNRALVEAYPGLRVYGGAADHVSCCTHRLHDGDTLRVGSLTVTGANPNPNPNPKPNPNPNPNQVALLSLTISGGELHSLRVDATAAQWRAAGATLRLLRSSFAVTAPSDRRAC